MPIAEDQVDSLGFCQAHHLIKHHDLTPRAVLETEPKLAGEVEGYCVAMGVGGWSV
jgi:hypothetical protein